MAKSKRGPSRMDLRRENEAVEARDKDKDKEKDEDEIEDEDEDEDEDEEGDDEADAEGDDDVGDDADDDEGADDDDDDEDAPKKKKKKKVVVKKEVAAKPSRKRTVKEVRMKALWIVLDNGGKRVGTFAYSEKKDAEKLMAEKIEEKKATFYLELAKEPIEEKVDESAPKKAAKKK